MKTQAGRNFTNLEPDIDCDTCIRRKDCERAKSKSFCTQWASREPADRGPDPSEAWNYGREDYIKGF